MPEYTDQHLQDPTDSNAAGTAHPAIDPWASGGRSFYELYVAGEIPWPQESLFSSEDGDAALEYIRLLDQVREAQRSGDDSVVRRLRSEINDVRGTLEGMGAYSAAFAMSTLRDYLNAQADALFPDDAAGELSAPLAEPTRFAGPAPLYLRGRTYAREVMSAMEMASYGRGEHQYEVADQLLRAVEETTDAAALQDFVAGVAREVEFQVARARERSAYRTG